MLRKASVVIVKDENGFYAWCPGLKGCQSQGATLEGAIANINQGPKRVIHRLRIWKSLGQLRVKEHPIGSAAVSVYVLAPNAGGKVGYAAVASFMLRWLEPCSRRFQNSNRFTCSEAIQNIRTEVDAVRPHDCAGLRVNPNLPEEFHILQPTEHPSATDDA